MDGEQLERALAHYTGSETFTRYSPLFRNVLLTDGALFLAKEAGAFWLMDLIASHQISPKLQTERHRSFQNWTLTVNDDGSADARMSDEGKTIVAQHVEHTDFPLKSIQLFACGQPGDDDEDENYLVIMLPSEY